MKLADRFWQCDCAELVQRDANAALNIRDEAIRNLVPTDRGEFHAQGECQSVGCLAELRTKEAPAGFSDHEA